MKPALILSIALGAVLMVAASAPTRLMQTGDNPNPPSEPVRLIFIHHSTGENWLADDNGGLGLALGQNNYFVSDTNYGWGPEAIGDRTDIPNWPEWFRSPESPTYLAALYSESQQHSAYTRTVPDPGGENQIVLFKSCFPNSNLSGNPGDAATPGEDYTVGNAKYVYNEILKYFITRPDKLFVVITAPPVSDPSYAANARAFNQWLVNDWLKENGYTASNVAVFDFYNVLTGPDNHHRFYQGAVEHVTIPGRDTAYYPSAPDDDHPSQAGNLKATQEFVPMLNVFYHHWKVAAPSQPMALSLTLPTTTAQLNLPPAPVQVAGLIDDFEAKPIASTDGWQTFWDEATSTTFSCTTQPGIAGRDSSALQINFQVAPESWATCALFFDTPQDWSAAQGLHFDLHATQENLEFDVDLYTGGAEERESYLHSLRSLPENASGWSPVALAWEQFQRADWEENGGAPFEKAGQVTGIAFGLNAPAGAQTQGTLWLDNLGLSSVQPIEAGAEPTLPPDAPLPTQTSASGRPPLRCLGGFVPLALLGLFGWWRRKPGS
jgi:hypothetical protein